MEEARKKLKILKQKPIEEELRCLSLTRKFNEVSNSLKTVDGLKLYNSKDNIHWINAKAKQGSKLINYYAFNDFDFRELNILLNEISVREQKMKAEGYNLEGIKSFNRNVWIDLSRESNAIEGIFEDFNFDLLDFRTKIRGEFAIDPSTKDFDKYEYFKKMYAQIEKITENNDCVILNGNRKSHVLKLETIRHFMAFKYIYKCAKKDRQNNTGITAKEFTDMIQYVSALLSGNSVGSFRIDGARVEGAPWNPVDGKDVMSRLTGLAEWFADDKQSGRLHPIQKAAIFHAEYIRIHPFVDGNGRTGRILTNYALIRNEMPTISVRYKNTQQYYDAIDNAVVTHEIDDLVEIFYNEVLNSAKKINECLDYIETKKIKKTNEDRNMTK